MASPKPFLTRVAALSRWLPYACVVGLFLGVVAQFYLPREGFTALVAFGQKRSATYLPELRATDFFAERDSDGYDAQYYAQIAMHPQLRDPVLKSAIDSLPYRARRILFCWTAYGLGAGNPVWALHVFSIQNVIAWLLLGWVLLRWFPPTSLQNFLRWTAVMASFGLCFSVRDSLVDGPSLLLIAVAMVLFEKGQRGWSAVVMGIASLGKETNALAAAAFVPKKWRDFRGWRAAIGWGVVVALPLLVWLLCLQFMLGKSGDLGARNFDWPFVGYFGKWRETFEPLGSSTSPFYVASLLSMLALTAQWLFIVLRPRWNDPWWRIGASYAVLMVVLGEAVWEGVPGAAPRVLLPMTLVFNLLLSRSWRWLPLLVLGNLLVWPSTQIFVPPPRDAAYVVGSHALRVDPVSGGELSARFSETEWHRVERSYFEYWRWAKGSANIILHNPHAFPVTVNVQFRLKSNDGRDVTVRAGEHVYWQGSTHSGTPEIGLPVVLPPGDTTWRFETDRPPAVPNPHDSRLLSFRICDLTIKITGAGGTLGSR